MLSKRTTYTSVTALPAGVSRELVIEFLHEHADMIALNPLVTERHRIDPPAHAGADERDCIWYSITDKIAYLPGGLIGGDLTYTCAFNNLPNGLQTHCYAPTGLVIRGKWTLNGTLPGEPAQPAELGIGAPTRGLYLREDVDMRCNMLATGFVKKNLKRSHAVLVERLSQKAQIVAAARASAGVGAGMGMGMGKPLSSVSAPGASPSAPTHPAPGWISPHGTQMYSPSPTSAVTQDSGYFDGGGSPLPQSPPLPQGPQPYIVPRHPLRQQQLAYQEYVPRPDHKQHLSYQPQPNRHLSYQQPPQPSKHLSYQLPPQQSRHMSYQLPPHAYQQDQQEQQQQLAPRAYSMLPPPHGHPGEHIQGSMYDPYRAGVKAPVVDLQPPVGGFDVHDDITKVVGGGLGPPPAAHYFTEMR